MASTSVSIRLADGEQVKALVEASGELAHAVESVLACADGGVGHHPELETALGKYRAALTALAQTRGAPRRETR